MDRSEQIKGTLLVVDDFELNRDMLSRRLQSRGFDVLAVSGGRAALEKISQQNFDLVLLDIMMPDMDGYEVLEHLRKRYTSTDIAVIMVTARDQSEDVVMALEKGADDYLTKPIDFPVAMARITNQLKRRKTEMALRESEERYALAAHGANDGLWDWNLRTHKVYFSERWKSMLGYQLDEVGDEIDEWFSRVHPDDLYRLKQNLDRHLKGETQQFSCEYRISLKDGSYRWMLCRGSAVKNESQVSCRMVGWQTDTTNHVQHDNLTNLPNRALLLDRIMGAALRARRPPHPGFAVFYLGLDRFKVINDSLGHEMGDRLLVAVTKRLEKLLRPGDTMSRLGGDEFAVLAEGIRGVGHASQIASIVHETMKEPFNVDGHEAHLTLSCGIVLGDEHTQNAEELLRHSHSAMDEAKAHGKNCHQFYTSDSDVVSTLQMENYLRKALDYQELFLHYQPQIDTKTGQVVGVEALLRWQNETLGLVPPSSFIPLAEETDLIVPIGAWVLRRACEQHVHWRKLGLEPLRVGVNISSRQFRNGNLPELVERIISETGIEPRFLELELTESLLMKNVESTIRDLTRLHEIGVVISIDDFGTGYSSLSYLKQFRIDTLKVDRSFVRDITDEPDDAAIASAIISMAHSLRQKVIAEGVETAEQMQFLKELGCDEMQGYLFSRPIDPEELAEVIRENRITYAREASAG